MKDVLIDVYKAEDAFTGLGQFTLYFRLFRKISGLTMNKIRLV